MDKIIPQVKLLKLLQIIERLKMDPMTVNQISHRYCISQRTAYRYIDIIEAAGFVMDQDFQGRYFIHTTNKGHYVFQMSDV